jgi:H+/gluconate symporter-like permease
MPTFGTTPFAAPFLGIIAAGIMLLFGMVWLNRRASAAAALNEGYGVHPDVAPQVDKRLRVHSEGDGFDIGELCDKPAPTGEPGIFVALLPIVAVIALNFVFSKYILPALDTSFLALPEYGQTDLGAVKGIWSIIAALACSIVLVIALNWKRFADFTASVDSGANASVMPIFNTASLVGFGAVIALLPAFATISAGLFKLGGDNPLISLSLSVGVLAGITGSASGGMSIVLQSVGAKFVEMAMATGVSLDLMHRVTALAAGGLDCLPHGGAVITLLQICNLKHGDSYLDIFAVSVAGPVIALIAVIILGTLFGSF